MFSIKKRKRLRENHISHSIKKKSTVNDNNFLKYFNERCVNVRYQEFS